MRSSLGGGFAYADLRLSRYTTFEQPQRVRQRIYIGWPNLCLQLPSWPFSLAEHLSVFQ